MKLMENKNNNDSILGKYKFSAFCDYKQENYSPLAYDTFLDEIVEDFFPKEGDWNSNCFNKSKVVAEENLPCHLRDDAWLADLIIKKYNLNSLSKETIVEYIKNSDYFNKLRYEYEQKIVSWQIDWMLNGGENWIVDGNLGGEFYLFSPSCDYAFRKGIVATLLAIGMDLEAIEEGIEKNASKWREKYMRCAFYNLYSNRFNRYDKGELEEPSKEHYEKWMKLRLYEYYMEHKDSVHKYGEILPAMQMDDLEVESLRKWLEEAHNKRIAQLEEYKNSLSSTTFERQETEDGPTESNKPVSLIKRLFKKMQ